MAGCSKGTFEDLMVYQAPPDSDGSDGGGDGGDSDAMSGYWSSVSSVASVSSRGSRRAHPTSGAAGGDDADVACMVCYDQRGVASDLIYTCDRCLCGFHVRCLADAFLGPVLKLRQLIPKQGLWHRVCVCVCVRVCVGVWVCGGVGVWVWVWVWVCVGACAWVVRLCGLCVVLVVSSVSNAPACCRSVPRVQAQDLVGGCRAGSAVGHTTISGAETPPPACQAQYQDPHEVARPR